MITKRFSKAKANANRVTWTDLDAMSVPFHTDGFLINRLFGFFRVVGRPLWCQGFKVVYDTPPGSARIQCTVGLVQINAGGARSRLVLNGTTLGGEKVFPAPLAMPASSLWCFQTQMGVPDGCAAYLPLGMTATYQVRYVNGPGQQNAVADGVGALYQDRQPADTAAPVYAEVDPLFTAWNRSSGINVSISQVTGLPAILDSIEAGPRDAMWLRMPGGMMRPLYLGADGKIALGDPQPAP